MNFLQNACKGKTNWWRYLLTLLIVFICQSNRQFSAALGGFDGGGF